MIERLSPLQLGGVLHLLETMTAAGNDRDTLSNAGRKAVLEADEWLRDNKPIPHEEVLAEFGLTLADWDKMGREPLTER